MNPFTWVSDRLEELDRLQQTALALYVAAVLLVGFALQAYDDITSLLVYAAVSSIVAIPSSMVIGALLELLAKLYDSVFST